MEYVKVIALILFLVFVVLQIWWGQKARIIAYFFFIISATLYILNFDWPFWFQIIVIISVIAIVVISLYIELRATAIEHKNDRNRKQETHADQRKKNK